MNRTLTAALLTITLTLGVSIGVGTSIVYTKLQPKYENKEIVFPDKLYTDIDATGFVFIRGRIAGGDLAYKNNVRSITCTKDRNECVFYDVQEIGANQISIDYSPISFQLTRWDQYEISGSYDELCIRSTVSIDRKNKTALIVEEPINQGSLDCKDSPNKTTKYTLEGSLFWDSFRKRNRK